MKLLPCLTCRWLGGVCLQYGVERRLRNIHPRLLIPKLLPPKTIEPSGWRLAERLPYLIFQPPRHARNRRWIHRPTYLCKRANLALDAALDEGRVVTPDMVVGSKLHLDRVGTPFDGDGYYVVHVAHTYDLSSGFRTHFEAQRATVNEA